MHKPKNVGMVLQKEGYTVMNMSDFKEMSSDRVVEIIRAVLKLSGEVVEKDKEDRAFLDSAVLHLDPLPPTPQTLTWEERAVRAERKIEEMRLDYRKAQEKFGRENSDRQEYEKRWSTLSRYWADNGIERGMLDLVHRNGWSVGGHRQPVILNYKGKFEKAAREVEILREDNERLNNILNDVVEVITGKPMDLADLADLGDDEDEDDEDGDGFGGERE
jgi:hypothetical protein